MRAGMILAALLFLGLPAGAQTAEPAPAAQRPDSLMLDVGEVLDELLWPEPYLYQSAGARDPFETLLGHDEESPDGRLVGVEDIIVVGVLWGARDRFALVETRYNQNLILRKGDVIRDGEVLAVLVDGLKVRYSHYGVVKTITLPVESGAEEKDER